MSSYIIPHHLQSQLDAKRTTPESTRCSPGAPSLVRAQTSQLTEIDSSLPLNNKLKVGYCFDGSFLPTRNGCSYTLLNLMRAAAKTQQIEPFLILCDRGTDQTEQYLSREFSTIFIAPEDYYGKKSVLEGVFRDLNISIAQMYSSEGVLNLAPRLKHIGVKTVFEIQNTDHLLLKQLRLPSERIEEARIRQIKAQKLSDKIMVRSERDAKEAKLLGANEHDVFVYDGAIYPNDFRFFHRNQRRKNLVFLGHLYYEPNQNALRHIVQKILPKLTSGYTLTAIGIGPEELIDQYVSMGVVIKSEIDDLSNELLNYDIALAPLTEGSGTRLKVLDYLASGIPVISTSVGIEGLHDEIKDCIFVEDNLDNYSEIIKMIADNPEKYAERSKKGRRYVEDHYSWGASVKTFHDVYESLTKDGSSQG